VTTHIELPPYRGPQSPLNLVAIEIIFGRLFEAFQNTSQAISAGTSAGADNQLTKKAWALPTMKMLVPWYVMTFLLFFFSTKFDLHSDDMTARRRSSARGPPKKDDKHVVVPQTITPVTATATPSPVVVIGSKVAYIVEAWDYAWHATEFLEGLKNGEANREGTPFSPFTTSSF
jgi:hypothetical protein